MLRCEITWRQINVWLESRLIAMGFDLSKEIREHCMWEGGSLTLVYEQDDNAKECKEVGKERRLQEAIAKRPEYLK